MADSEHRERTPGTFRVMMTPEMHRNANVLVALRQIKTRDFWENALEEHLKARRKAHEKGVDFVYEAVPRNAESFAIYADEGLVADVDEWAIRDNMEKKHALYTAFLRHVERGKEEMTKLFDPEG